MKCKFLMPTTFHNKCCLFKGSNKMVFAGEVFNSTSLPSGNLVDGLLLDIHTDARAY